MIDDTSHGRVEVGRVEVDVATAPTEPPARMTAEGALAEIALIVQAALKLESVERDPIGIVMAVRELARESNQVHARNLVLEEDVRLIRGIANGRRPR